MQKNTYGLIDRHPSDMVALGHEGGKHCVCKSLLFNNVKLHDDL
jgi:hypothetical protein